MIVISLDPVKEQTITATINDQPCTIRLVQRESGMYIDLYKNDAPVCLGVPCLYANKIVRYEYLGFAGDLVFLDTQGQGDPHYTGLGGRFTLNYLEPDNV